MRFTRADLGSPWSLAAALMTVWLGWGAVWGKNDDMAVGLLEVVLGAPPVAVDEMLAALGPGAEPVALDDWAAGVGTAGVGTAPCRPLFWSRRKKCIMSALLFFTPGAAAATGMGVEAVCEAPPVTKVGPD